MSRDTRLCRRWQAHALKIPVVLGVVASAITPVRTAAVDRAEDGRLQQKITFEAMGDPLEEILRRLSEQTGVRFTFEGRAVGDRKAVIIARNVSLAELKGTLAASFFGFQWLPVRRGARQEYLLYQSQRARQLEDRLQSTADGQQQRRLGDLITALQDGGAHLDAAGRKLLQNTGTRLSLEELAGLSPGHMRSLFAKGHLRSNLTIGTLTAEQRAFLSRQAAIGLEKSRLQNAEASEAPSRDTVQPYPLEQLPDATFEFILEELEDGSSALHFFLTSSVAAPYALGGGTIPLSPGGADHSAELPEVREYLTGTHARRGQAPEPSPEVSEMERKIAPLSPEQARALKQVPYNDRYGPYWLRWLVPFARRTEISLVSDYFTEPPSVPPRDPTGLPLGQALDEGAHAFGRRWVKKGPLYSFRHERWYLAARTEPPERVLSALRAAYKQNGLLRLEDLAVGGELTLQQLSRAEVLDLPYFWVFRDHYPALRLLNCLTPPQVRQAQTAGLSFRSLSTPASREWFKSAAWSADPTLREEAMRQMELMIRTRFATRDALSVSFRWRGPEGSAGADEVRLQAGQKD